MELDRLLQLAPPPAVPVENEDNGRWQDVQKQLKCRLPSAWREISLIYGTGYFQVDGNRLTLLNPLSPQFYSMVIENASVLQALRIDTKEYVPFPVYPRKNGVLPLGEDAGGNGLNWKTAGDPDSWPILARDRSFNTWETYEGPLTGFLVSLFTGKIVLSFWEHAISRVAFVPTTPMVALPEPTTLYELYVENGSRVGFWAYKGNDFRRIYLIKLVGGRSNGQLDGIPLEYNRQQIIADCYLDNKLEFPEIEIFSGYQRDWRAGSPPG